MIPLHLKVENFRSFGDSVDIPLDFARLFCIVGNNGAGKSTIVEAMLWALFGISRKKAGAISAIRTGAKAANVRFDFKARDETYRVIRYQPKKGLTKLRFMQEHDGEYRPIVESHRKSDVQNAIFEILGIDYDGLRTATVFMQNESALFSLMKPGERRKHLAKMLGIERYQRIRDAAAQKVREIAAKRESMQNELQLTLEELSNMPDTKKKTAILQEKLDSSIIRHNNTSKKLVNAERRFAKLNSDEEKSREIHKTIAALQRDIENLSEMNGKFSRKISQTEELLRDEENIAEMKKEYDESISADRNFSNAADEFMNIQRSLDNIRKKYYMVEGEHERKKSTLQGEIKSMNEQLQRIVMEIGNLEEIKDKVDELELARNMLKDISSKSERYNEISKEISEAESHIAAEHETLINQLDEIRSEIAKNEHRLANEKELHKKSDIIAAAIKNATDSAQKAKEMMAKMSELEKQKAILEQKRGQMLDEWREKERQMKFVQSDDAARCPRCGSELTGEHRSELLLKLGIEMEKLELQGKALRGKLDSHERQIDEIGREIARLEDVVKSEETLRKDGETILMEIATITHAREQLSELHRRTEDIDKKLDNREFAATWRGKLSKAKTMRKKLAFNPDEMDDVRKIVAELLPYEGRLEIIREKEKNIAQLKKQIESAKTKLDTLQNNEILLEIDAQIKELSAKLKEIPYNQTEHQNIKRRLNELVDIPEKWFNLQETRKTLPQVREQQRKNELKISQLKKESAHLNEKSMQIEKQLSGIPELKNEINILSKENTELENSISKMREEMGGLTAEMKSKEEKEHRKKRFTNELKLLGAREILHRQVSEVCGPLGIQDWLMQSYLATLQDDANDTLNLIMNGGLSLRLIPEEGEKLAVRISDEFGERAYETYSGGEEFRIDFALRLALSRLLANRSGFPLRTLIIDEGFGSQDEQGIARLVETIYDIQSLFDRVIVITHLPALRDSFPARIVVTKENDESRISVEA